MLVQNTVITKYIKMIYSTVYIFARRDTFLERSSLHAVFITGVNNTMSWTYTTYMYNQLKQSGSLLNPLHVKFFSRSMAGIHNWDQSSILNDACSWNHFSSKTDLPIIHSQYQVRQTYLSYTVNIMGANVLATQGARASATLALTMLNRNNSVPTR